MAGEKFTNKRNNENNNNKKKKNNNNNNKNNKNNKNKETATKVMPAMHHAEYLTNTSTGESTMDAST